MNSSIFDLFASLRKINARLYLDSGNLRLEIPKRLMTQTLKQQISTHKEDIIAYLSSLEQSQAPIPKLAPQDSYVLSYGQRRLWVLSQFATGSLAYNMPLWTSIPSDIDLPILERSVLAVIERHEVLRTVFKEDAEGEVFQQILPVDQVPFQLRLIDLSNQKQDATTLIREFITKDTSILFDLSEGPLLRAYFIKTLQASVLYYNMHHIISDGWSMDILSRDILAYYAYYKQGVPLTLPKLKIQYKDYAHWQLSQVEEPYYQASKEYWLNRLSGSLAVLDFPSQKTRPLVRSYQGRGLKTYVSTEQTRQLKSFIKVQGGSLYMGLLASISILFHRYTQERDIIIGSPTAGRDHADLEDQIGFYINTLVQRTDVDPTKNFQELYQQVKEQTLEAFEHQRYPFDHIVESLNIKRDTSRNAVFDVMLTLQNISDTKKNQQINSEAIEGQGQVTSKFDLEIVFEEVGDGLEFNIIYNTAVYERGMVERMMVHYKTLLSKLCVDTKTSIGQIDYLTEQEKHQLLYEFNNTNVDYPKNITILDYFEEQVEKNPENIAVVFEEQQLTYKELDVRSSQLAIYLSQEYKIKENSFIGIYLDRSEHMIIGIISILKMGCAYVPIDPQYPNVRTLFIIKDAGLQLVLSDLINHRKLHNIPIEIVNLSALKLQNFTPFRSLASYNSLAYLIYTSGSTGKPKGVKNYHKSVLNRLLWGQNYFQLDPNKDVVLQKTNYCFDVSVWEFFWPIMFGVKLVIAKPDGHKNMDYLIEIIQEKKITTLHFVPSMLENFLLNNVNPLKCLSRVLCSGEALTLNQIQLFKKQMSENTSLYNLYGPTEAAIEVSCWKVPLEEETIREVSIGFPIHNTQLYVLDQFNNLMSVGLKGELCIGGIQLSKGYLNRPVLTKEKFTPHPFEEGEKIYRTGDLARWLPDGSIEFLGRLDYQLKIRGLRVEPGEIEQALLNHPNIERVIVIPFEFEQNKDIIAYLQIKGDCNRTSLRSYLQKRLPSYMIPQHFVKVKEFPVTANGKLDIKSLPMPFENGLFGTVTYVAPKSEEDKQIVKIWQSVLGGSEIGLLDDFFDLGGHSLKVAKLLNEYQKTFKVRLNFESLFINTTVASHRDLLLEVNDKSFESIPKVKQYSSYQLSYGQRRLWVLSQISAGSLAYNMPFWTPISSDIDIAILEHSVISVIERHEILRTTFVEDAKGEISQLISPIDKISFQLVNVDLSNSEKDSSTLIREFIDKDTSIPFDLSEGPLLRGYVLNTSKQSVLYYNTHHIISDGWSMNILSRDILKYYAHYKEGIPLSLPELKIQYKDYAHWQLSQVEEPYYQASKEYWLNRLSGSLAVLDFPSQKTRPLVRSYQGRGLKTYVSTEQTRNSKALSKYKEEVSTWDC